MVREASAEYRETAGGSPEEGAAGAAESTSDVAADRDGVFKGDLAGAAGCSEGGKRDAEECVSKASLVRGLGKELD